LGFYFAFLGGEEGFLFSTWAFLTSFIGPGLVNWCELGPVYIGL